MSNTLVIQQNNVSIEFTLDNEGDLWIDINNSVNSIDAYIKMSNIVKLQDWLLMQRVEFKLREMLPEITDFCYKDFNER